jgi:hypothetical protein
VKNTYKIEKNLPFKKVKKYTNYPFDLMEEGDSFWVPEGEVHRARCAAYYWGKRNDIEVYTASEKDGVRIWRGGFN